MAVSILVVSAVLALGPQWAIVDLPYPEVGELEGSGGVSAHSAVVEAALSHARTRKPGTRKPEVHDVRIDGAKASAILDFGDRTESIHLRHLDGEWRLDGGRPDGGRSRNIAR